jgi:hypothetical protein
MKTITRLNCSNCKFLSTKKFEDVTKEELNKQGGMKDQTPEEKSRARKIKLITLPGDMKVTTKYWCDVSSVDQWVTEHMWCRCWEADGTLHPEK